LRLVCVFPYRNLIVIDDESIFACVSSWFYIICHCWIYAGVPSGLRIYVVFTLEYFRIYVGFTLEYFRICVGFTLEYLRICVGFTLEYLRICVGFTLE